MSMYVFNPCMHPGCKKQAVSTFDSCGNILEGKSYCLEHHPDALTLREQLKHYIETHDTIVGLNAQGMVADGLDFSGKKFIGCNFQNTQLSNIHAENIVVRMCVHDFSTFTDCYFNNSNIQFSSYAGCRFGHVLFTGSDLIHNNYNGIMAYQCSFDDSDLYNTRFIKAILMNASMKNCNLKKTVFYESNRDSMSFKMSNTRDALTDRTRGGLMGDFAEKFDYDDNGQAPL